MFKRLASRLLVILLLTSMLTFASNTQLVNAEGVIYIRADGIVDPLTAPISTIDNVTYTLTDNIASDADGIVIERNNIIIDGAGYTLQGSGEIGSEGIYSKGTNNITIRNINFMDFDNCIEFDSSSYILICGNNMTQKERSDYGVSLFNSSNCNISGNNIENSGYHGIDLFLSSFNTVSGNNIIANNFGVGLSFSSYNVLSENNIAESVWSGVELDSSSYNVVSKNKIDNIALFTSTFNVISNNVISDGVGLYYSSDSNTVARNNITNAGPGVRISESSNNRIFHNNFIDNIPQVISATSLNFWDNGYPSGGNYWSDYVGSDLYHGFYQNESGSDGKGDTPYVIDANNSDRYPLVQPYKLLIGDLNGDDQVNMMDISVVAKAFGSMPRHPRWNPIADIDKDGYVDMRDVSVVAKNFGKIG